MLQWWQAHRHKIGGVSDSVAHVRRRCYAAWADHRHMVLPPISCLPAAGIDAPAAQAAVFRLASEQQQQQQQQDDVVHCWLHALQLVQVTSDRLMRDMALAQRSLRFWQLQLAAGGHSSFMLLGRGPGQFVKEVLAALHLRPAQGASSDRMQERVLALQAITKLLAQALGEVHLAAVELRGAAGGGSASGSSAQHPLGDQASTLQHVASAAVRIMSALQQLHLGAQAWQQPSSSSSGSSSSSSGSSNMPGGGDQARTQASSTTCKPANTVAGVQQQLQELQHMLQAPSGLGGGPQGGRGSSRGGAKASQGPSSSPAGAIAQPGVRLGVFEHAHHGCRAAADALRCAAVAGLCQGPLLQLPRWVSMPSHLQRHWIKYAVGGACTLAGGVWLLRHSRVCGSDDLDRWVRNAVVTALDSVQVHVVEPLVVVRDELFRTFRDRPSIVSVEEYQNDKDSLLRMLADFEADRPLPASASGAAASAAPAAGATGGSSSGSGTDVPAMDAETAAITQGMARVMLSYEAELPHPIRNLMAGDLARSLLIQVQRLKLDTESAILELDQILKANELSISLVAAVPSLLLLGVTLQALWRLVARRTAPDTGTATAVCRLAAIQLGQELLSAQSGPGSSGGAAQAVAVGMVAYRVNVLYQALQRAYRLKDVYSKVSEWPLLVADVLLLGDPQVSTNAKLAVQQHMLSSYAVLQPASLARLLLLAHRNQYEMSKLDCLQRQLDEVDVLRAVYPEEGCIMLASAEQEALQAAAAAIAANDTSAYVSNISGLVRIPGLQLWGAPVGLRFCLPGLYPEAALAEVSVDCSAPRGVHDKLTMLVKEAAASVELGDCSLLVVLEALQVAVEAVMAEHPEATTSGATRAGGAGATRQNSSQLLRCVVWFHHIKSITKRKQLVAWARELDVAGYSKPGFPGVLVCEGWEADVREYLARVRSLSWQAMQVRGEQLVPLQAADQQEPLQHDSTAPGGPRWGRAFAVDRGFQELPETGMSQLGQICKDAGLEDLFLAALKIER